MIAPSSLKWEDSCTYRKAAGESNGLSASEGGSVAAGRALSSLSMGEAGIPGGASRRFRTRPELPGAPGGGRSRRPGGDKKRDQSLITRHYPDHGSRPTVSSAAGASSAQCCYYFRHESLTRAVAAKWPANYMRCGGENAFRESRFSALVPHADSSAFPSGGTT